MITNVLKKYKAISLRSRFRIVYILLKADTPLCICELMDILQKKQYSISRSMGVLKDAELVTEERDGRLLLYSLDKSITVNKYIFTSIQEADKDLSLDEDIERLRQRLALRDNGKVVITYQ